MPADIRRLPRAAVLATALALLASVAIAQEEDAGPAAEARAPAVTVADAVPREFLQRIPVSGTLIARDEVLVFPAANGYAITELSAEVGDRVTEGETLALIDDRALKSQLAQAEAEQSRAEAAARQSRSQVDSARAVLNRAGQSLDRTRQLRERGTTTQAALDEAEEAELTAQASYQSAQDGVLSAEAQLHTAEAALDVAELNLSNAQITAPVSGVISESNGQIGAIAATGGEPIYRIVRDGIVEVEVQVVETELALLGRGDTASLDIAGLPAVRGTVRLVWPVVDRQTRLGTVRIALEPREGLRPGLFAGGWITVAERTSLSVPSSAVITDSDGTFVLAVVDGRLDRRPVEAGLIWEDRREIRDGLSEGDTVVARAGAFFTDGDAVRPVRPEDADTPVAATGTPPSDAAEAATAEDAPEAAEAQAGAQDTAAAEGRP